MISCLLPLNSTIAMGYNLYEVTISFRAERIGLELYLCWDVDDKPKIVYDIHLILLGCKISFHGELNNCLPHVPIPLLVLHIRLPVQINWKSYCLTVGIGIGFSN